MSEPSQSSLQFLTVSPHLSFADWKTGAQRPHQIDLDHGWQSGIYSGALRSGYFVPFDNVPERIVHRFAGQSTQ